MSKAIIAAVVLIPVGAFLTVLVVRERPHKGAIAAQPIAVEPTPAMPEPPKVVKVNSNRKVEALIDEEALRMAHLKFLEDQERPTWVGKPEAAASVKIHPLIQ